MKIENIKKIILIKKKFLMDGRAENLVPIEGVSSIVISEKF